MEISQILFDKVQPFDQANFEKIKDSEFRPSYDLMGMKYLRDKAGNERNLRELYRGRAPYELLQNADDVGAKNVAFILSSEGLAFVHDGRWFTLDNFRSLADGWSDKDPNQCIGHKGLGFRSVLDITPAPYLLKVDSKSFFAVKFTWALNNGHIQQTFQKNTSLRLQYEKWTQHGQIACPVMAIPGLAKKHNLGQGAEIYNGLIRGKFSDAFTTMFWLPAADHDIDPKVLEELSPTPIIANQEGRRGLLNFLDKEVRVLLPFLSSIEKVKLYYQNQIIGSIVIPQRSEGVKKEGEITVRSVINDETNIESFYQLSFPIPIPPHIKNESETPKAVRSLKKASITLSLCLEDGQPIKNQDSNFHVYFPTDEPTGTGFIIHGDFYVKPDRTRLMPGTYNEWLLNEAAVKTAGEFLSKILKKYRPGDVFKSLSPTSNKLTGSADFFVSKISKALKKREKPFIPSKTGLLTREEVVIPPDIDKDGFWDGHFSDEVELVVENKKAFIDPKVDNRETRSFLKLADVWPIERELLIDFIESASGNKKDYQWWYECYGYLAKDEKLSQEDHLYFVNRKLVPLIDKTVIPIPGEKSTVLCLPPKGSMLQLEQPDCFKDLFLFVDSDLAEELLNGPDIVLNWVSHRFRISKFEASDLIPRAVRNVSPKIFKEEVKINYKGLMDAWVFLFKVIKISRQIVSSEFWQEVGRFPVPISTVSNDTSISSKMLSPGFLCYFPEADLPEESCIKGINGFRRISDQFLDDFEKGTSSSRVSCIDFFHKTGISYVPKLLKFKRVARGKEPAISSSGRLSEYKSEKFAGEYQKDMNRAVLRELNSNNLLESVILSADLCQHETKKTIQSLALIEGIGRCTNKAEKEFEIGDENWKKRLQSIIENLSASDISEIDKDNLFCRGGSASGHSIPIRSYLKEQLHFYKWLPASTGPASKKDCFLRLSTRRLISKGQATEELGDKLIPYVVVDDVEEYSKLEKLGVEPLEDPDSCSSNTLIRALKVLGEKLSSEWGVKEFVSVRHRWRFVRGAIQEVYRILNNRDDYDFPEGLKLAVRTNNGYKFETLPLFYADPGSPVEKAFEGKLLLIDTDRPYPNFFDNSGIIRLVVGKNVNVKFLSEETSEKAQKIQEQIIEDLSKYLLAPIVAKSEKKKHVDLVLRRLRERFSVHASNHLRVLFSLSNSDEHSQEIEFPKFYLDKRTIQSRGAIEEYHYKLYLEGTKDIDIFDIDADALGEVLTPIFLDGISDDLKEISPRIANRYQVVRGDPSEMAEYLYNQLGVSKEAQETALLMITGKYEQTTKTPIPQPPPIKIITKEGTKADDSYENLREKISDHKNKIEEKATIFIRTIENATESNKRKLKAVDASTPISDPDHQNGITPEQQERGKKGEEEIKRRLKLPGGWEGFILNEDKRYDGCGYDFLCSRNDRNVMIEVKTFIENGRIIFTSRELQEAAISKKDYYLIGILDTVKPPYEWSTYIIQDPIHLLLKSGEFDIQAKLQAPAATIFEL
jgi:Protein NO VEIN, C-terminal